MVIVTFWCKNHCRILFAKSRAQTNFCNDCVFQWIDNTCILNDTVVYLLHPILWQPYQSMGWTLSTITSQQTILVTEWKNYVICIHDKYYFFHVKNRLACIKWAIFSAFKIFVCNLAKARLCPNFLQQQSWKSPPPWNNVSVNAQSLHSFVKTTWIGQHQVRAVTNSTTLSFNRSIFYR